MRRSDGRRRTGLFPFGDAVGYGSTGGIRLNQPIVGMPASLDGFAQLPWWGVTAGGPPGAPSDGGWRASGFSPEQLAWGVPAPERTYWPARIAVAAAVGLYFVLPDRLIPGPRWIVPMLEGGVLLVLSTTTPHRTTEQSSRRRTLAILLVAIVTVTNLINLGLLVHALIHGGVQNGRELIFASAAVWFTNVIVFGLWYWELDRGGPQARHDPQHREPDFLFPQMTTPGAGRPGWAPAFVDYLYVSFTNATAFSPTDTMPLTPIAKSLMAVQSAGSLLTVALVAARAVNILS
ncbi:MAG TPA: hypothetical protein VFC09_04615 [Candidatus Dormibacteraeota bacterium]|nr:hypothetical protein [Candidatus Dormibacteraeota bacterium]